MLFLGSHVSIDKGYTNAIIKSKDINANAWSNLEEGVS